MLLHRRLSARDRDAQNCFFTHLWAPFSTLIISISLKIMRRYIIAGAPSNSSRSPQSSPPDISVRTAIVSAAFLRRRRICGIVPRIKKSMQQAARRARIPTIQFRVLVGPPTEIIHAKFARRPIFWLTKRRTSSRATCGLRGQRIYMASECSELLPTADCELNGSSISYLST
jgi:hypothetical protein